VRLLGKKVLRNTCGLENDEVTREKRKLQNKYLQKLFLYLILLRLLTAV